jgi:hypothetical protein
VSTLPPRDDSDGSDLEPDYGSCDALSMLDPVPPPAHQALRPPEQRLATHARLPSLQRVAGGILATLILVGMASCAATAGSTGQPTIQATATATPTTARSGLDRVTAQTARAGATLGGSQQAFDAAFGASSVRGTYYVRTCGNSAPLQVYLVVTFSPVAAGLIQLSYIDSPGGGVAISHAMTKWLVPVDAVFVRTGASSSTTTVDIDTSATVGAAFPPDAFTDIHNNLLPRGTFSIGCGTQTGGCVIGLGTT